MSNFLCRIFKLNRDSNVGQEELESVEINEEVQINEEVETEVQVEVEVEAENVEKIKGLVNSRKAKQKPEFIAVLEQSNL